MLEKLKQELAEIEAEYTKFKIENKDIFNKKKQFKKSIENLSQSLQREMDKVKPEFPLPLLRLNNFVGYFDDVDITISEEDVKEYEDEDISALLGWKVDYESDGHTTHTDGDWYDYSLTLTSPEGYVYSYSGETCLCNGEFQDNPKLL